MHPLDTYKYFGLYSISIFALVILVLVYKWHQDFSLSISQHVARNKTPYIILAVTSVMAQSLFVMYIWLWFIPTFKLGYVLPVLLTIGSVGQVVAGIIPDTKGLASRIHYTAALTMGVMMYAFVGWMSVTPAISGFSKLFSIAAFSLLSLLWLVFFFVKKARQRFLLYQGMYLGLFWATVIVAGYLS